MAQVRDGRKLLDVRASDAVRLGVSGAVVVAVAGTVVALRHVDAVPAGGTPPSLPVGTVRGPEFGPRPIVVPAEPSESASPTTAAPEESTVEVATPTAGQDAFGETVDTVTQAT